MPHRRIHAFGGHLRDWLVTNSRSILPSQTGASIMKARQRPRLFRASTLETKCSSSARPSSRRGVLFWRADYLCVNSAPASHVSIHCRRSMANEVCLKPTVPLTEEALFGTTGLLDGAYCPLSLKNRRKRTFVQRCPITAFGPFTTLRFGDGCLRTRHSL
jgi:hypothetical protein